MYLCRCHGSFTHQLKRQLMKDYPGDSRPVHNISRTVAVDTEFILTQILDLDQDKQVFSFVGWLKMVSLFPTFIFSG